MNLPIVMTSYYETEFLSIGKNNYRFTRIVTLPTDPFQTTLISITADVFDMSQGKGWGHEPWRTVHTWVGEK